MEIPGRETARTIIHMTDMLLLSGGDTLPAGLTVALREYKSALLAECAGEKWARIGYPTRYGITADIIGQQLADGKWKPGERMPSIDYFAAVHGVKYNTAASAMHVLAVRGQLALENGSYYVLPRKTVLR
jgi:hypothetical protein